MAVAGTNIGTGWITIAPSLSGFQNKLNTQLTASSSGLKASGTKSGGIMGTALGTALGVVGGKAISAAVATIGKVFTSGMARYTQIENSQAKLTALGKSTAEVDEIMKRATASVKGTAFGLGEAVDVAAQMTASMKDMKGERLEATLTTIANASAVAGTSMGEMGAIFAKAAASNKVQGDILNQLGDRGIPIVQWLADEVGVTAEAVYDMSRRGAIDFATFERAMANGMSPDAAVTMGKTLTGTWANTQAALGRLGAKVLELFGPLFKRTLEGAITVVDSITGAVENFFTIFRGDDAAQRPQWLKDLTDKVAPAIETARETVAKFGDTFKRIYGDIIGRIKEFAGSRATQFADTWKSLTNVFSGQMGNWTKAIDWVRKAIEWLWGMFGDSYITAVLGVWGVLSDAIQTVVGVLEGVVTIIGGILSGDWTRVWNGYKKIVGSVFDGIVDILWTAVETVAKLLGVDAGTLAAAKTKWDNFWRGVKDSMASVTAWWEEQGKTAWEGMTSWWQQNAAPRVEEFQKDQAEKWGAILGSFAQVTDWWNRPGDGGKASWDSLVGHFRTFIDPFVEDLNTQWQETWTEIKSAWQFVPDWWNRPGDGGKATWDSIVDLFNRTVKPTIEELKRIWNKAWREIKAAAEPVTNWWKRPGDGGEVMFSELAGKWAPEMSDVLKILAAVIVGPLIIAFKTLEGALKALEYAAVMFKSAWAMMERYIFEPIQKGVLTAIDILNALIRGYNKIAILVGVKEVGEITKPSFAKSDPMFSGGGSASMGQFYDGGATPNVGKFTPAGVVHGNEHVWTSDEVNRFPGGHAGLYKLRAMTMAKRLDGLIPGFFLGGHVPVPGGRVTNRHPHPYYSSRWAGDLAMPTGTPIYAWKDGIVAWTKHMATSYGRHLLVNHANNESSLYAHASRILVKAGDIVKAGMRIAEVGSTGNSTGPHLHFEVRGGNSPLGGDTGTAGAAIRDFFGDLKASFTGPLDRLKEIGDSPIGELIKAIPRKAAEVMLEKVKSAAVFHANHGYWRGTDHARPGWAWVGERGPELMRLRGGEQILSHENSMRTTGNTYEITYAPVLPDTDPQRQYEDFIWRFTKEADL